MAKATFIKDLDCDGKGSSSQKLWKVGEGHVITSAASPQGRPETYVFPTDEDGSVTDWGELEGSFQGSLDHDRAINGYMESLG